MVKAKVNIDFFYKLYGVFMEIDSVASLVYGRNRDLIKSFFYFYLKMANGDIADRSALKNKWEEYVRRRGGCRACFKDTSAGRANYLPTFEQDPNLAKEFLRLANAVEHYREWRASLQPQEIKKIYVANTKERHGYYANNALKNIEDLIEECDVTTMQNNQILKQTLIEFHNAISHLYTIVINSGESNKGRAINHFRRGALDSYKAIIKDYCYLLSDSDKEVVAKEIKELRKMEYQNIGNDKKDEIFSKYENITADILNKRKEHLNALS